MVKTTIGKRVRFAGDRLRGTVEDEGSFLEEYEDRDFLDLIQYIRWDDGGYGIRICYYVREHGSGDKDWIFANRPLSVSPDVLGKLLKKASKKKWFSEVFKPTS